MKNTLSDLNNYLFEELERLQNDELSDEELEKAIKRAEAVTKVSETVIRNGELALKTMQHLNEYGYGVANVKRDLAPVPAMLIEEKKCVRSIRRSWRAFLRSFTRRGTRSERRRVRYRKGSVSI